MSTQQLYTHTHNPSLLNFNNILNYKIRQNRKISQYRYLDLYIEMISYLACKLA